MHPRHDLDSFNIEDASKNDYENIKMIKKMSMLYTTLLLPL